MPHILGIGSALYMLWRTWAMGTSTEVTTKVHMVLMRLQLKSSLVLSIMFAVWSSARKTLLGSSESKGIPMKSSAFTGLLFQSTVPVFTPPFKYLQVNCPIHILSLFQLPIARIFTYPFFNIWYNLRSAWTLKSRLMKLNASDEIWLASLPTSYKYEELRFAQIRWVWFNEEI